MPRRSHTTVSDVPVDVLIALFNHPEQFQPRIDEWKDAKGEAIRDRQRAEERVRVAGQKEASAAERLEAAEKRESELDERETALAELDVDLGARGSAVAAREQAAQEREKELSGRETTLDERLGAVRLDLAALRGL